MASTLNKDQAVGLVGWLGLCFAAAGIGAIASIQPQAFYAQLTQPAWAPPPAVFGPVWTVLYTLMAVAAWLVWRKGGFRSNRTALPLFCVQLSLNALWTWLFFAWQLGAIAFVEIIILWGLILTTIVLFWRVRSLAGALLIPYLLWVSFAAALNYAIWQLNPLVLG